MKVIILMAGQGSRFQILSDKNPLYKIPKPLILARGKPMVSWAIKSLPFNIFSRDLIFVAQQVHEDTYQVTTLLKSVFGKDITVILIPQLTRGAAESALFAKEFMTDEELIISDSDHYFDGIPLRKAIINKEKDVVGIIPVFTPPDTNPRWSFTLTDKNGSALAVAEKDTTLAKKGALANIGAYYFTHGHTFRKEAEEMIASSEMHGPKGKKEFYIAPIYQRLIKKGMKIQSVLIPKIWGLGTPQDLELFEKNYID